MFVVLPSSWDSKFPLPPSVKKNLTFWKENASFLIRRPTGQQLSGTRSIVYSDARDVGAGELLRALRASFPTSLGPLTTRSMFVFLAFLKRYLVAQCSGLRITIIFLLSFAEVA